MIIEKYRKLRPSIKYMADEVVMAQAWKKTHGYIRSFNWYADTLALDISALTIEENAKTWTAALKKAETTRPLELIPAVKSELWEFNKGGWVPSDSASEKRKDKRPLRPLAHINIRDQTWASVAMLCLADAVETAQGNCSDKNETFEQARNNGVFSYGNRLVCDWNSDREAWFRWGNSETYRKFFVDYQNFLQRPLELGRNLVDEGSGGEEVYVLNLDLEKFYDKIDKKKLISRLRKIALDYGHQECEEFWEAFGRIIDWKWGPDDIVKANNLDLGDIQSGLPQGLVASGFFANAYLAEFDQKMGKALFTQLDGEHSVVIHDYCRYVDDLRLVVSADGASADAIADKINNYVTDMLLMCGESKLQINKEKTKINLLTDLDNSGRLSRRLKNIQTELSGPADRDVLDTASGLLESLLESADDPLPQIAEGHRDAKLLEVCNFDHDIRSDTLKRFAANRLETIVRNKRRIIDRTELEQSGVNRHEYDDGSELLAKKLIKAWTKDPSLAIVLRKAMEIYPDAALFEPILEAIYTRSSFPDEPLGDSTTAAMMDYLLADLFRCGSDFNGYFQTIDYPKSLEASGLIELLARYAQKVFATNPNSKCTIRQALMLLAVANKPIQVEEKKATIQHTLHSILVGDPPSYQPQRSALFEVAAQITGQFDSYASLLLVKVDELSDSDKKYEALEVFAKRGGPFWLALWKRLKNDISMKDLTEKLSWAAPLNVRLCKPGKQLLSRVICSDQNGFVFEHGVIKLALGLIDLLKRSSLCLKCSPKQLWVDLDQPLPWERVWSSEVSKVSCNVWMGKPIKDPRFSIPEWVKDSDGADTQAIYWIGMILRAAVVGGIDFTGNHWKTGKTVTYKGLRTSWYKRRMGMMHAPEALVGEVGTISSWTSDLLARCLQWPGYETSFLHSKDVPTIVDLKSLRACLRKRLEKLDGMMCKSVSLPLIPTEVRQSRRSGGFRLVTVQQLLPQTEDFCAADVYLNNPNYRARHRDHLLTICKLVEKTLEAKSNSEKEDPRPAAGLIVFPELSVHIDDQDVIKRLADKTQSIIFAGLVFTDISGKPVNIARWFIPTQEESGRQWIIKDQGKGNLIESEIDLGIQSYRPCQHLIEIHGHEDGPFRLSGAICYDATDIQLAADLRNQTDLFVVVAHNKDVTTFDSMAAALHYHMYQHVVIANIGQYGGSTIQAPYKQPYDRHISHVHGVGQIAISTADLDLAAFRRKSKKHKDKKAMPAGISKIRLGK